MLAIRDAIIDETVKPAIEWINGKAIQKLMPTDLHSILQLAFARFLDTWSEEENRRGRVGPEWRFIIPLNSYKTESVVPDVAYLATYFDLEKADRTYPTVPPDIAVEILSPDDEPADVKEKREFYIWWGVKLVIIADPVKRTVKTYDPFENSYSEDDILTSNKFPSLNIPLRKLFAKLDDPAE